MLSENTSVFIIQIDVPTLTGMQHFLYNQHIMTLTDLMFILSLLKDEREVGGGILILLP